MNRLYHGDNLTVLTALLDDPEVCGQVQLAYLDPPYTTGRKFLTKDLKLAYTDTDTVPELTEHLRARLELLHTLLAPGGALYLHLDERMSAYMRPVLDSIFGAKQYRNTIVRQKRKSKNGAGRSFGSVVDYVLFYTKVGEPVWNAPALAWSDESAAKAFPKEDTRGHYQTVAVHSTGLRNGATGEAWRGRLPPPGKHWSHAPEKLEALDAAGEIAWSKNGNPRRKIYAERSAGVAVTDLWTDCFDDQLTPYPTAKPVKLLERIVGASSRPGDLVLDPYAGSGTTLVAAEKLGRYWIGIDSGDEAIEVMMKRLPAVCYNAPGPGGLYSLQTQNPGTDLQGNYSAGRQKYAEECC